jgi:hypothetical protein
VLLRVIADKLFQIGTFREGLLVQIPVVLGHPEVQIRFGSMRKVS